MSARRYVDLQRALPGVSPNLLAERLRELERAGLVAREDLPPPAARTVYVLTEEGRRARGVVAALARFGMRHLADPTAKTDVRPTMAIFGSLHPFFDRDAAAKVQDHYRLVLDGKTFDMSVMNGRLTEPAPGSSPNLVLEMPAHLLVAARKAKRDLAEAARKGKVRVQGDPSVFKRFLRVFDLADATVSSKSK